MTLFDSYCNDGMSAGIWVIDRGGKFALGQSLGPRDAKSLLRQISWYSGYTLLSCIRLY